MALVGEAHIIVRAITTGVARDIKNGFNGIDGVGRAAGKRMNKSFMEGFNNHPLDGFIDRVKEGLAGLEEVGANARRGFHDMVRIGYTLSTALSTLLGGISAVIGGIVSLGATAVAAIPSVLALANVVTSIGVGMAVAKLALGGVGKAISAANKQALKGAGGGSGASDAAARAAADAARIAAAKRVEDAEKRLARVIQDNRDSLIRANDNVRKSQLALNQALKAGREEIQQLGFKAEDAALAEQQAALDLEDARRTLAGVQDLAPNSRARMEAELAYQTAELGLRKAKDASADLNAEQDRLAKTGVRGTDTVISATNALADAQAAQAKTVRDGMQNQQDAVDNLNDALDNQRKKAAAPIKAPSGGAGANDPYAGLNDAQKKFAKFIVGLKPQFDKLKLIAAESFLPLLQQAIETLMTKAYPTVAVGIGLVGTAMGDAAVSLANAMTTASNLKKTAIFFKDSADIIRILGSVLGRVWGIALSVLNITAPLAKDFVGFLDKRLKKFDEYLDTEGGKQKLTDFFNTSKGLMKDWGTIFGNIFNGLGDRIGANVGPGSGGQNLLDWLKNATGSFATFGDTAKGKADLKKYFQGVASNTQKIFGAIGKLMDELTKLGANPAIGQAFDALAKGAPALGDIITKSAEAGPALGRLIAKVTEIVDVLTDTVAIQIFFNTLKSVADTLLGFFSNPLVHAIMDVTGRIAAFLLALGLMGKIGKFAFHVLLGEAGLLTTGFNVVMGAMDMMGLKAVTAQIRLLPLRVQLGLLAAKTWLVNAATSAWAVVTNIASVAARAFGVAIRFMTGPIGIIITVIAAVVASLIYFFTQTKLGKEIWANFTKFIGEAIRNIGQWFSDVFKGIGDAIGAVINWVVQNWPLIFAIIAGPIGLVIEYIVHNWSTIVAVFQAVWDAIVSAIVVVWDFISGLITGYIKGVQKVLAAIGAAIAVAWGVIWNGISKVFKFVWAGIVWYVTTYITIVRTIITTVIAVISTIWNKGWSAISSFFSGIWSKIVKAVQSVGKIFRDAFGAIAGFVRTAFQNVLGAVKGPLNAIIDIVNKAIRGLNKLKVTIPDWFPVGAGMTFGLNIPTIPRLASGGTVFPSKGGSMVNVAEAGSPERIEPLDKNGLSARDRALIAMMVPTDRPAPIIQITIQAAPGMDIPELAKKVGQEIADQMRKGAI